MRKHQEKKSKFIYFLIKRMQHNEQLSLLPMTFHHQAPDETNDFDGFQFLDDSSIGSLFTPLQSPIKFPIKSPLKSPDFSNPFDKSTDQFFFFEKDEDQHLSQILNDVESVTKHPAPVVQITQQINQIAVFPLLNTNPEQPKVNSPKLSNSYNSNSFNNLIQLNRQQSNTLPDRITDDPKLYKRKNFPEIARKTMKMWLLNHWAYPYPTAQEKRRFAAEFNLTDRQIDVFLTNQRSRLLKRRGWGTKKNVLVTKEMMKSFNKKGTRNQNIFYFL